MTRQELERLEELNLMINEELVMLEDLRKPSADSKTKCFPGAVSVRYPADPTGVMGVKAAQKSIRVDKLIDEYYDLRCEVCRTIRALDDTREAVILCQRYIHLKTWEEVQKRVKCRRTEVFTHHNIALQKIK